MKKALLAVALATAPLAVHANPESYTIDPNHTFVYWEVEHLGVSLQRDRFERTDFGMKFLVPAIGDEVRLWVSMEGYKD